jgi:hypothetical protein
MSSCYAARARYVNVKSVHPTRFEIVIGDAGHARDGLRFTKDQESG